MRQYKIVGLGEVLWDLLPTQKVLGGAPANFAYISSLLGDVSFIASRVGTDDLGEEMLGQLQSRGLNTDYIQKDPQRPTGTVKVSIRDGGQPSFEITEPVAWDFLQWNRDWESLACGADAVCFGSLAQRNRQSRATIRQFLAATRRDAIRVFDMNLRQHFFPEDVITESIASAQIVKLNDDEVVVASRLLHAPSECFAFARWLQSRFHLKLVCVTFGAKGSLIVSESGHHRHDGISVKVADTIGAGDAFTAAMVHHFLRGSSIAEINAAANLMGSLVAGESGAMPSLNSERIQMVRAVRS